MRIKAIRWILLFILAFAVTTIDQITKAIVVDNLARYETVIPIPAVGDYLRFTHNFNTGAAFGILPNAGDLFIVLSIIIIGFLLYSYRRIPDKGTLTRVGVGLIVGGALGNLIDRVQHGHVTDFIHYRVPDLFSNVSNLADHAIVLGVILIVIDSFRLEQISRHHEQAEGEAIESDTSSD